MDTIERKQERIIQVWLDPEGAETELKLGVGNNTICLTLHQLKDLLGTHDSTTVGEYLLNGRLRCSCCDNFVDDETDLNAEDLCINCQ